MSCILTVNDDSVDSYTRRAIQARSFFYRFIACLALFYAKGMFMMVRACVHSPANTKRESDRERERVSALASSHYIFSRPNVTYALDEYDIHLLSFAVCFSTWSSLFDSYSSSFPFTFTLFPFCKRMWTCMYISIHPFIYIYIYGWVWVTILFLQREYTQCRT